MRRRVLRAKPQDARTTQIQALHDYEAARARLERAIGENVPSDPAK
jgi:hypothetical protein